MKHKRFKFKVTAEFSCNDYAAEKVTDELLEKNIQILGFGIAQIFGFDRLDAACMDKVTLTKDCECTLQENKII